MKNKDRYNLKHMAYECERMDRMVGNPQYHIVLIHENKPIISFYTEKAPLFAILDWLEEDLEDY